MTASSWYRRSMFNYKGNREYTRTGFEAACTRFVESDLDVDCSERHYMITGSNSGIGLQTALEVAKRGGVIHMVCRNPESASRARSEIITTTGNDKIHLHIVDLAKPRDVIVWAQRFAAQHEKLHVLVHNAGCMVHQRNIDQDGVEYNFAVNTLAVHILTLTFMPLLERSEDPRVVTVSSAGLLCVRLDPHDLSHANLDPFLGTLVYSQNKRQQVVMTLWYAQRYNKVHFSSMHPGWADTPAVRTSIPQFYEMMKENLRTPAQGADTVVWLAISKAALKHPSGLFFQDREPVSTHLPLAWTKSSIEEEDFLMSNIQDIYTQIYNKIFSSEGSVAPSPDTPTASPITSQPAPDPSTLPEAAPLQASTGEQNESITSSEHKEEESTTVEHPLAPEIEPATYPVLPPPPPPAEKAVTRKTEVQEVAEIHAPPSSSQPKEGSTSDSRKEDSSSDSKEEDSTSDCKEVVPEPPSEESKPSESPAVERKAESTPDEDVSLTPSTPDKEKEEKKGSHDSDDDSSSTASTEQVTPEP